MSVHVMRMSRGPIRNRWNERAPSDVFAVPEQRDEQQGGDK